MKSIKMNVRIVRRFQHKKIFHNGLLWSEKDECLLVKDVEKEFIGLSEEASSFFNQASETSSNISPLFRNIREVTNLTASACQVGI